MTDKTNRELLIEWYEYAFERYGEALQENVSTEWYDHYGNCNWEKFHDLGSKIKVKFYYEDGE